MNNPLPIDAIVSPFTAHQLDRTKIESKLTDERGAGDSLDDCLHGGRSYG
jgi:hypothetical protein